MSPAGGAAWLDTVKRLLVDLSSTASRPVPSPCFSSLGLLKQPPTAESLALFVLQVLERTWTVVCPPN